MILSPDADERLYVVGCVPELSEQVKHKAGVFAGIGVGVAFIQVISILYNSILWIMVLIFFFNITVDWHRVCLLTCQGRSRQLSFRLIVFLTSKYRRVNEALMQPHFGNSCTVNEVKGKIARLSSISLFLVHVFLEYSRTWELKNYI